MVNVRLKKAISEIEIEIKYEDRNGEIYENMKRISFPHKSADYFDDIQIRKALTRISCAHS